MMKHDRRIGVPERLHGAELLDDPEQSHWTVR